MFAFYSEHNERRLTKRFSVEEVLARVSGHDEEDTGIEPEIEEEVSEVEDNTVFDPDFEETEQAPEETFQPKSGHSLWSSSPPGHWVYDGKPLLSNRTVSVQSDETNVVLP
ncbi:hypothetical protein D9C73_001853 [Collichthys lucidus]|uniref:Uncharacterized protein n=1 Tax=Collichthys lucidus TaxID=240159 RepID=A0A4U5TYN8_COLLU|nr:hypothetical protein D9C73_001853 [Collichthys lucidus]